MDRTESYLTILDATAKIQFNVALILEAKALHAEKSRNWICHHLSTSAYESNSDHIKKTGDIHEQLIAVIEGITKMEAAFAKNLGVLIAEEESTGLDAGGGLGDLLNLGDGFDK
ncbi:restriction endonuclease subunit S [Paenibacillus sedimenti]|uniref:Restriction endonuclease subunit S n=1 Tax=Paenibacillus sedimenti TaxID=2770274 RepID=A0A926KQH8_9BACL|nr:restriction endonuclease subunit S [Paenibacillus sedimenti]MBD0381607.1 restriction endonuclease subunit S [Paenibacillus sedimenti]